MYKLVASAIANARVKADASNSYLDEQDLFISQAFVDEGTTLKRFQPRAQGRAFQILKRTSHITVVLATPDEWPMPTADDREGREEVMGQKVNPYGFRLGSPPTTCRAGSPTARSPVSATATTSPRTSRSATCSRRASTVPALPASRSSAPVTASASTSTPPVRAS